MPDLEVDDAEIEMPIADQFRGARYGRMKNPFGHSWSVGSPLAS